MDNNTARESGGAVYVLKGNLTFINGSNMLFARNKAITGGAVYFN